LLNWLNLPNPLFNPFCRFWMWAVGMGIGRLCCGGLLGRN
jgi:hypothetical protein